MRAPKPQAPGLDLVPAKVRLPREFLSIAKDLAAKAGVPPDITMGAILATQLERAASPEAREAISRAVKSLLSGPQFRPSRPGSPADGDDPR